MRARKMEFWPRQLMRRLLKSSSSSSSSSSGSGSGSSHGTTNHGSGAPCTNHHDDFSSSSDENWSDLDTGDPYSPRDVPAMLVRGISETLFSEHIDVEEFRIVVASWNVAGRTPPSDLELEQWLDVSEPADIYVIGLQEMVPLNPGNVLGAEQDGVAGKWEMLIRRTLNRKGLHRRSASVPFDPSRSSSCSCSSSSSSDVLEAFSASQQSKPTATSTYTTRSTGTTTTTTTTTKKRRGTIWKKTDVVDDGSSWITLNSEVDPSGEADNSYGQYVRVVSKQMVGVFLTVWARRDIKQAIRNIKMSCVGCGLMGYLGNKGSVSVSLSLHETSFCFICAHLTSGEKEGDELRRNADVAEILRRTSFHRPKFTWPEMPETIMEHDRVIWFGDLNYRLSLADAHVRLLVGQRDWPTLLKRDQLSVEKLAGRVFDGWSEGAIDFAPTYKYVIDTNRYSGELMKPGERKRTPAWCDRILWNGKGLRQLNYVRAEYKFSDHRPVRAVFLADVEIFEDSKLKNLWTFSRTKELLGFSNANHPLEKERNDEVPLPAIAVC